MNNNTTDEVRKIGRQYEISVEQPQQPERQSGTIAGVEKRRLKSIMLLNSLFIKESSH